MIYRFCIVLALFQLLSVSVFSQEVAPVESGQTPQQLETRITSKIPEMIAATVAIKLGQGSGSGVIVSPEGLVLTAAHVINKPGAKLTFLLSDGREFSGTALGVDHSTDAGIAKIDSEGPFPYQPFVEEKTYAIGDWVLALGHPGGPHVGRPSPVRLGQINRAGEESGFADPISTTAFVISGDSGGPLFDLEGRVIGINSNVSGNWDTNNHVPLPAFIKVWEKLNAGETVSTSDEAQEPDLDDPFRFQRDYFYTELEKRPDDIAAHLLKRPQLLDPHHTQNHLDRWAREAVNGSLFDPNNYTTGVPPEAEQAPNLYLGLKLDPQSKSARITAVEPNSAAERAGLLIGDEIVGLNKSEITNLRSFSHRLSEQVFDSQKPPTLQLSIRHQDGEQSSIEIIPKLIPARRYFRQPLSVLSDMMMSNAAAIPLSEKLLQRRITFQAGLPKPNVTVLSISRKGKRVSLATAVSANGALLTKASEIIDRNRELIDGLEIEYNGQIETLTLVKVDSRNDLAVVKIDATDLVPANWVVANPTTGEIVSSVLLDGKFKVGILTQPQRPAPKVGFDHIQVLGEAPPYLGISLAKPTLDRAHPSVELIEPESPADLAGFLEGDIILSIAGDDIANEQDLNQNLKGYQPGEKLRFTVERGDRKLSLSPILGVRSTSRYQYSSMASRVDQSLLQLSARGGALNRRRQGFPRAIYHDTKLVASTCGGPLYNLKGEVVGVNISRSLRHRTLAIPAAEVIAFLAE